MVDTLSRHSQPVCREIYDAQGLEAEMGGG